MKQGAVTAFYDWNCMGEFGRFETDSDPKKVAFYNEESIDDRGWLEDNVISSVMIPYGTSLKLFAENGFIEPKSLTIDGLPSMSDSWPMDCINLLDKDFEWDGDNWNDETSSLQVYRTRLGARARGRWTAITATEKLKFHYHVGMASSDSTESSEVMSQSINLDVSAGFEYMGASASASVSSSWADEITTSMRHDMT